MHSYKRLRPLATITLLFTHPGILAIQSIGFLMRIGKKFGSELCFHFFSISSMVFTKSNSSISLGPRSCEI